MMTTVARDEFVAKYGSVEVKFFSYYKYTFTYTGTLPDGSKISVDVGGNSDDIYRMTVTANDVDTVAGLNPYAGSVYKDGQEVDGFYDY